MLGWLTILAVCCILLGWYISKAKWTLRDSKGLQVTPEDFKKLWKTIHLRVQQKAKTSSHPTVHNREGVVAHTCTQDSLLYWSSKGSFLSSLLHILWLYYLSLVTVSFSGSIGMLFSSNAEILFCSIFAKVRWLFFLFFEVHIVAFVALNEHNFLFLSFFCKDTLVQLQQVD